MLVKDLDHGWSSALQPRYRLRFLKQDPDSFMLICSSFLVLNGDYLEGGGLGQELGQESLCVGRTKTVSVEVEPAEDLVEWASQDALEQTLYLSITLEAVVEVELIET